MQVVVVDYGVLRRRFALPEQASQVAQGRLPAIGLCSCAHREKDSQHDEGERQE